MTMKKTTKASRVKPKQLQIAKCGLITVSTEVPPHYFKFQPEETNYGSMHKVLGSIPVLNKSHETIRNQIKSKKLKFDFFVCFNFIFMHHMGVHVYNPST